MTNIAYELGNQVQEKLETSDGINSISYESLLIMGWVVLGFLEMF